MAFFHDALNIVINFTATLLVAIGLISTPQTFTSPPEVNQLTTQTPVEEVIDSSNFADLTCSGAKATTTPTSFSLPNPVLADSYADWNFFTDSIYNTSKEALSFAYPANWDVTQQDRKILIYPSSSTNESQFGSDAVLGFTTTIEDYNMDQMGNWLRACYGSKNIINIGSRNLNDHEDFQPVWEGAVMYLIHDKSENTYYLYRGQGNKHTYVTKFYSLAQMQNPTNQKILSSFSFYLSEKLPTSSQAHSTALPKLSKFSVDSKPTPSPNGKYLAFTRSTEGGDAFAYIADVNGDPLTEGFIGNFVTWEPDSSRITVRIQFGIGGGLDLDYYVDVPPDS